MLDFTVNYVEHPHVVRNRILEAVDAVGDRERVIAGTDCGFGTLAGWSWWPPPVWKKFELMAEGARRRRLPCGVRRQPRAARLPGQLVHRNIVN